MATSVPRKRAAIYDPWLRTLGGGEKVATVWAEALSRLPGLEVDLLGDDPLPAREEVEKALQVDLSAVNLRACRFEVPWWVATLEQAQVLFRVRELWRNRAAAELSRGYDLFVNVEAFSRLPSAAPRGIYYCMFPQELDVPGQGGPLKRFYEASLDRRRRRWQLPGNFLDTYTVLTVLSRYSQRWLEARWHRPSRVLYPPVDTDLFSPGEKAPIILAVGRFFAGMHNKKHLPMIQAFRELCDAGLAGWELHLAGGRHMDAAEHREYYRQVEAAARGYPIHLHPDASFPAVRDLYARASIFWHATGYGEDEQAAPEKSEHFGITTAEAMAAGAVPVVIARGGQPEIVEPGHSGFLWEFLDELKAHTLTLIRSPELLATMSRAATARSELFAKARFCREVQELALELLAE